MAYIHTLCNGRERAPQEGKEVDAFPPLPPLTTPATTTVLSPPQVKKNKRAVTPRTLNKKALPLREHDPRERELRSMRQLRSGLELEIERLNQQNKVLVGENNKTKKQKTKYDLMRQNRVVFEKEKQLNQYSLMYFIFYLQFIAVFLRIQNIVSTFLQL